MFHMRKGGAKVGCLPCYQQSTAGTFALQSAYYIVPYILQMVKRRAWLYGHVIFCVFTEIWDLKLTAFYVWELLSYFYSP